MKIKWRGLLVLAAVAVVAVIGSRALFRPRPIVVEVNALGRGPVENVVANSEAGTVRSRQVARLGAERTGRIASIPFREGLTVRRGAVLLELDPSTAATRLEAARRDFEALRAAHESAHSALTLARQTHVRVAALHAQNVVSAEQLDEATYRLESAGAELRAAEARVESARSAVGLARDELAHHQVRAPFDGTITRRLVEVGESVVPGQAVLEIMSLDRLYVSAPIDERDVARLAPGLPARVTVDTYPGVIWDGRLARVAPMVEEVKEQNRTLEVEVDLPVVTGKPQPRPGMTADVEIVLDRRDDVLRVPSFAVTEGPRVLVVERGRAVSREVSTGVRNWQWTEVRSGLAEGQTVITSLDRAGLKTGSAVKVNPATPPAKPSRNGGGPTAKRESGP